MFAVWRFLPNVSHYRWTIRVSYLLYLLFVGFGMLSLAVILRSWTTRVIWHMVVSWLIVFVLWGALSRMTNFDKFRFFYVRLSLVVHIFNNPCTFSESLLPWSFFFFPFFFKFFVHLLFWGKRPFQAYFTNLKTTLNPWHNPLKVQKNVSSRVWKLILLFSKDAQNFHSRPRELC